VKSPLRVKNHWHSGQVGPAWHYADSRAGGIYPQGRGCWGSGRPGLCARPFSSTSGPRKTDRRKQQHPSPSPCSSSICIAELDGPARMWRALLLQLFLLFICCVRWCHSEGMWCDCFSFNPRFCICPNMLSAERFIKDLQSC